MSDDAPITVRPGPVDPAVSELRRALTETNDLLIRTQTLLVRVLEAHENDQAKAREIEDRVRAIEERLDQ